MKKILILVMLAACFMSAKAQNADDLYISGTVTYAGTITPVPGQNVIIYGDSMNTPIVNVTVVTNNLGFYSYNIVGGSVIGPNKIFHVATVSCNTVLDTAISNNQGTVNTAVADFAICQTNPGTGCQPIISAYPDSLSPLTINFLGGVSMFTVGTVTSWSWSFGDGTGSSIQNPQHTFATAGLHIVCLTIATDSGCTSVICDSVYVGSNTGNCTSNFTYQASGLILSFTGYSSSNYPATWTWDFGDSTGTITGINNAVTHTYAAQGYYTVCLTTLDSTGCTDTYCQTIYVGSNVFNSLCGTVSAGGALLDHGLATLYTIDTTSGTATWYQTVVLDSSSHYCFLNIPNGTYIVLAAPDSNSSVFNLYFPTYYGDVLNWGDATVIVVPGNPAPGWDINLIGFNTPSPGNGNIGGGLFLGGAKGIGDAVPGVTVLLYDASLDALISTVSDDNGLFIFSNLAYGTYTVYPEIPGLNTIPAVVILNSTNPDADNLYFSVNSDQIVAGMEQQDAQITSVSDVYPNPANANSGIAVVLQKPAQLNVTVLDITGRKLSEKNLRMAVGNHFINVNAEKLTSGVYQIILTSDDGNRIIRQFVK